jgi:hypothetical protein
MQIQNLSTLLPKEILPKAKDVTSTGTAEFDDFKLDDDVTQTRIVMDGFAMFDENGEHVLSQDEEIRKELVTKATLRDYFQGICVDMEAFEAKILEPNAKVDEGTDSSTFWVSALCNADNPVEVAAGLLAGVTVATIVIVTVLFWCICVGLFACCCKHVFCPCC